MARLTTGVAILGSTGSIGRSTLDVIDHLVGAGEPFRVVGLTGHRNASLLAEQVIRYRPRVVGVTDAGAADEVAKAAADVGAAFFVGPDAPERVATADAVDAVVHAIVGAAGLRASFAAAEAGRRLCLANKESLVAGGTLLVGAARRGDATLLPVDSEHSALFQAMACGRRQDVSRFWLTASGGPFRTWPADRIRAASVDEAMAHPTWRMGGKITVDSATLFNKALEVIEAARLFDVPPGRVRDEIGVVVHPQSVVHSMVEFRDGSTLAQMSPPDMKGPIGYALTYPRRLPAGAAAVDWSARLTFDFEPPDEGRFPALRLGFEAADASGAAAAVLSAANEVAVDAFLAGRLCFGYIGDVVEEVMNMLGSPDVSSLADVLDVDARARRAADAALRKLA